MDVVNKIRFIIWVGYRYSGVGLLIFIIQLPVISQEIKMGRISDLNYPEMECTFVASDPGGDKNFTLQTKDFSIFENTQKTEVIEVINPSGEGVPVSVVLVFDISGSMKNERIALAKEAAFEFLKLFSLETSEVAVASFSDEVYLNCDFTQDNNRLKDAITNLEPFSGTDYSRAFLFDQTGALDIAKKGKYKKAIVFLTDGLSSASSADIVKRATSDGISIYCITLGLSTPEVLKKISTQTGGKYYEAITNIYQLYNFYASIGQQLQTGGYSILRWRAINSCDRKRKVKLNCHNFPVEFSYEVSSYNAGVLMSDPNILSFGENSNTGKTIASVSLTAKKQSFTITDISIRKNNYFALTDTLKFPFLINKGESVKIPLSYSNKEPGLISDKLFVSSAGCPSVQVVLNGGIEEKLKLLSPTGGEIFPVGTDTSIVWDGIKRYKEVSLWYRTNDNLPWKSIGEGSGLFAKWSIPNDTGTKVKIRVEPAAADNRDFRVATRFALGNNFSAMNSNADASLVLTVDKSGTLQLWDGSKSRVIITLAGFGIRNAILSSDSKRIIGFTGFDMFVWDIASVKLVARYSYKQKLFVSDVDPDGNESLFSTRIYKDLDEKKRAWSPGSNILIPIPEKKGLTAASISGNGLKAITLNSDNQLKIWGLTDNSEIENIKIKPDVQSVVISPGGNTFVIVERDNMNVYNCYTGKELFQISHQSYKKFSGNGAILIGSEGVWNINFWDAESGKLLLSLSHPVFYKSAYKSNKVLFYVNGILTLTGLSGKESDLIISDTTILDANLSPDEKMLLITRSNNTIDLYDIQDQKVISSLNEFNAKIVQVQYSADSKNILVGTTSNEVMVLKPFVGKQLEEVVSDYFSIVAPILHVKDTIRFGSQFSGSHTELFVPDFAINKDLIPVSMAGMDIVGKDSGDFKMVSDYFPFSLTGNMKKEVEVAFNPTGIGIKKAVLRTFTASDTLLTELTGIGISKGFKTKVDPLDFGKVKVNERKDTLVAVLYNTGESPITIEEVVNSGPNKDCFTIADTFKKQTLDTGMSFQLPITFKPKSRGRVSGSLGIRLKECPGLQKVFLLGEGLALREVVLSGRTLNSVDKEPISSVLRIVDLLSGNNIFKYNTGVDGRFSIVLNSDRDYGITAEKDNFLSGSEHVDLSGVNAADTIKRDMYLTEIKSGAFIRMNCVFFDFAKSDLLPSSKPELDGLAETLKKYRGIRIEIQGHTDSIGNSQANMLLSKNRANAVRTYLIRKGTDATRLSILYFGESLPVTSNVTDEGRARNRRVEVKVK